MALREALVGCFKLKLAVAFSADFRFWNLKLELGSSRPRAGPGLSGLVPARV